MKVVVHRSRFEVDLNRPREAVGLPSPEDAWGLELWAGRFRRKSGAVPRLYDDFYVEFGRRLDVVATRGSVRGVGPPFLQPPS